jgi:uncharacterized cupredoxin-like copper-binding protein
MVAAAGLLLSACGGGSDEDTSSGASANRTIEIGMVDIAFDPQALEVERGETIRFVFKNTGKLTHDAFVGDAEAQADHEEEMRAAQGGAHGGHGSDAGSPGGLTLEPGKTGELVHTFDQGGRIEIGCHQSGHYAAGMKTLITVA